MTATASYDVFEVYGSTATKHGWDFTFPNSVKCHLCESCARETVGAL